MSGCKSYWYTAVTMAEYNKIVENNDQEGQAPTRIPGDLREHNGWAQLVWLPTCEEALCWLAFHNSGTHVEQSEETILIAYHAGQGLVNYFQRAHRVQAMQMHKTGYELNKAEKQDFRVQQSWTLCMSTDRKKHNMVTQATRIGSNNGRNNRWKTMTWRLRMRLMHKDKMVNKRKHAWRTNEHVTMNSAKSR